MRITELAQAIDILRKEGWTVEPPRRRVSTSLVGKPKRVGRPEKNGCRKRGRPRKTVRLRLTRAFIRNLNNSP
jgi:hypothetical protein